jgi:hypothetical protein
MAPLLQKKGAKSNRLRFLRRGSMSAQPFVRWRTGLKIRSPL